jgi:hypothetical protein
MQFETVVEIPHYKFLNKKFSHFLEVEKEVVDSFKNYLEKNNFYLPSVEIFNQETFEMVPDPWYGFRMCVVLQYTARERTKDDDLREQIEFNIKINGSVK